MTEKTKKPDSSVLWTRIQPAKTVILDPETVMGQLKIHETTIIEEDRYNVVSEVKAISDNLAEMQIQMDALLKAKGSDEETNQRIRALLEATERTKGQSDELTARLLLPPRELTDVRLVPAHFLERLEEYQSDENLAYLLIGAFVGALLGIPVNWATSEEITFNASAILLGSVFLLMAIASILWLIRTRRRAAHVKRRMWSAAFSPTIAPEPPAQEEAGGS